MISEDSLLTMLPVFLSNKTGTVNLYPVSYESKGPSYAYLPV